LYQTDSLLADSGHSAGISIVAGDVGQVGVLTPIPGNAYVLGAGVAVITVPTQPRVPVAVPVDVVASLAVQVRSGGIQRSAVCCIPLSVPIGIQVADVTHAVSIQVFLAGIEVERAVVLLVGHPISVHVSNAVGGAGRGGFSKLRAAHVVSARVEAIRRTCGPPFAKPANAIAAETAVDGAGLEAFSSLAQAVATGRSAVHGTVGLVFGESADAIAAHRAIHRTGHGVLAPLTDGVSTRGHAVHRAGLGILEHLAQAVSAGGWAVGRAQHRVLVQAAHGVSAAAAVDLAVLGILSAPAKAVTASAQAVHGAAAASRTQLVGAADAVAAVAAVHRAVLPVLDSLAHPISAGGQTVGQDPARDTLPLAAGTVSGAGVSIIAQRPMVTGDVLAVALNAHVHGARIPVVGAGAAGERVHTAFHGIAQVDGTGIAVLAFLVGFARG
jgi:hypothetical protein